MSTFEDQLLDILKCPVCYQVPRPRSQPVSNCIAGHTICESCRPRVQECPTCRRPFMATTNTVINNICQIVPHHCKYRTFGCQVKLNSDQIDQHESECPERTVNCCFRGDVNNCSIF